MGALRFSADRAGGTLAGSTTTTRTRPVVEESALVDPAERIRRLEHLLELEQARRAAMEEAVERLSARVNELTLENAALRGEV